MDIVADLIASSPRPFWPRLPEGEPARILDVLGQLDETQWMTRDEIESAQLIQLESVVSHAAATVPYYRERFSSLGLVPGDRLNWTTWRNIPRLTRGTLQGEFARLKTEKLPDRHGRISHRSTSGSTGQPVQSLSTAVMRLIHEAITLRDQLWHRRDMRGVCAAVRTRKGEIMRTPMSSKNWGSPISKVFRSGPAYLIDCRNDISTIRGWLEKMNPTHLVCIPSVLEGLCREFERLGRRPAGLRQVATFAEKVRDEQRALTRRALGVPIQDIYSSEEFGYIALQCPEHDHYHVQAENVLLEILDEQGQPCPAGRSGQVVITSLHNFAMPLIRYETGDHSVAGPPCPCGRGLPVLERVEGRSRGLIVHPQGGRFWPQLYLEDLQEIVPLLQIQLTQKTPTRFDVTVVTVTPPSADELSAMGKKLAGSLGYPYEFHFRHQTERIHSKNGKFEMVRSELTTADS